MFQHAYILMPHTSAILALKSEHHIMNPSKLASVYLADFIHVIVDQKNVRNASYISHTFKLW